MWPLLKLANVLLLLTTVLALHLELTAANLGLAFVHSAIKTLFFSSLQNRLNSYLYDALYFAGTALGSSTGHLCAGIMVAGCTACL